MKVTIGQLKLSESALLKLSKQDLPILLSFQLGRLIKQISPDLISLEETRLKLVQKYGTPDSESGQTTVLGDAIQKFTEELNPILDTEIQIDFQKIPISSIPEKVELNTSDVMALDPFLEYSV